MRKGDITKNVIFGMTDELAPFFWVIVFPKGRLRQIWGRKG
jgi:hypothetical protein